MNKKFIIKKNYEIEQIINKNNKIINKYFIVYFLKNNFNFNRYCISVSKKIGKANIRNLYKRRIKNILMQKNNNNGNDYVIILRKAILCADYSDICDNIDNIFKEEK